jgi:hypothetical protein
MRDQLVFPQEEQDTVPSGIQLGKVLPETSTLGANVITGMGLQIRFFHGLNTRCFLAAGSEPDFGLIGGLSYTWNPTPGGKADFRRDN